MTNIYLFNQNNSDTFFEKRFLHNEKPTSKSPERQKSQKPLEQLSRDERLKALKESGIQISTDTVNDIKSMFSQPSPWENINSKNTEGKKKVESNVKKTPNIKNSISAKPNLKHKKERTS